MDDREFAELVAEMKTTHHTPPPVPTDRLWARIAAARSAPPVRRRAMLRNPWPLWQVGLAAAAVLVLGIALGRMATRPDAGPVVAEQPQPGPHKEQPVSDTPPDPTRVQPLVRYAAVSLFNRADALLTDLQTGDCARRDLSPLPAWAGGMLTQTRLLLDTNLNRDAETKALLQDLELVLMRITSLSTRDCTTDVDRIRQDLKDKSTLDRLRLAGGVDPRSL